MPGPRRDKNRVFKLHFGLAAHSIKRKKIPKELRSDYGADMTDLIATAHRLHVFELKEGDPKRKSAVLRLGQDFARMSLKFALECFNIPSGIRKIVERETLEKFVESQNLHKMAEQGLIPTEGKMEEELNRIALEASENVELILGEELGGEVMEDYDAFYTIGEQMLQRAGLLE